MSNTVELPTSIFNVDEIDAEALVVYFWIADDPRNTIRDISVLSGINLQKVSTAVKRLENRRLIEVKRGMKISVKMKPAASVPKAILEREKERRAAVKSQRSVRQFNRQLLHGI